MHHRENNRFYPVSPVSELCPTLQTWATCATCATWTTSPLYTQSLVLTHRSRSFSKSFLSSRPKALQFSGGRASRSIILDTLAGFTPNILPSLRCKLRGKVGEDGTMSAVSCRVCCHQRFQAVAVHRREEFSMDSQVTSCLRVPQVQNNDPVFLDASHHMCSLPPPSRA